jgi:hypothetical protein
MTARSMTARSESRHGTSTDVVVWRKADRLYLDVPNRKVKRELLVREGYVLEDDDERESLIEEPLVTLRLDERGFSYALWLALVGYVPLTTDNLGELLAGAVLRHRMKLKDIAAIFAEDQPD